MPEREARAFVERMSRRRFIGLSAATLATGFYPRLGHTSAAGSTEADVVVIGAGLAGG